MRSVMQHQFSQVPSAQIPRSQFDRSHGLKTTFDAGYLVPVFVDEALPGDTFNLKMAAFARMATPLYPVMDNIKLSTFFFAVPLRLVWNNFQKFMGEQTDPGDSTDYTVPTLTSTAVTGYTAGSLYDYLGLPTEVPGLVHSALVTRAYNLIWNEWFRDENLQDSVVVDKDDGPDTVTDYVLLKRGKRHDYFTSALPWPQKGDAVEMPIGTSAPVIGNGVSISLTNGTTEFGLGGSSAGAVGLDTAYVNVAPGTTGYAADSGGNKAMGLTTTAANSGMIADLSTATAATINQIRQAFQLQRLYERDARGGTRYTEIIRSHFGVVSPDARLQRPEYLGGGTSPINIHPVANTSDTATREQGDLAAFATGTIMGHGFVKSFTEHTILLGLVCAHADLTYQQGLNRMWSRSTRWDFYWPALAQIGEQAILNKEIYAQGSANPTADAAVFGYQERYAEYRYKPSQITGQFRSNHATSLDGWHLAQEFGSLPALNATFIVETPPMDRILAVPAEPDFILDAYFSLKCARPMPMFGVPGMIDHF